MIPRRCDLCERREAAAVYAAQAGLWPHLRCKGCGLLRVDPLPADPAQLNRASYGGASRAHPRPVSASARAWLARQRADFGDARPRLLDVGCGAGVFLAAAAEAGFEAQGVELEDERAAEARVRGLRVTTGELAALPREPGFHLIRLNQVLEHVVSPRALLSAARERLAPGGAIHLATPNEQGLAHRVLGARWRMLGRPSNGHLVLLSPAALRGYAEALGLELSHLETRGLRAWSRDDTRHRFARRSWRLWEQARALRLGEHGDELRATLRARLQTGQD